MNLYIAYQFGFINPYENDGDITIDKKFIYLMVLLDSLFSVLSLDKG